MTEIVGAISMVAIGTRHRGAVGEASGGAGVGRRLVNKELYQCKKSPIFSATNLFESPSV